ncbi:lytB-related protein lytB2 [Mycobacterium tuberculosis]|nr:lytB-related protein lytB2 [Mycobacterium tuberculosis]
MSAQSTLNAMVPTVDMGIPGASVSSRSVADRPNRKRVLLAEPRGYCTVWGSAIGRRGDSRR